MRPNEQDRRLREQERKEKAQTTPQQTRDEAKKASVSACTRTGPSGSDSDTPPPRSSAPHYAAGRTRRDPAESMTTSRRCRLRPRTRVPHLSGQAPAPRVPWMSTMPTVEVASTRHPTSAPTRNCVVPQIGPDRARSYKSRCSALCILVEEKLARARHFWACLDFELRTATDAAPADQTPVLVDTS